MTAQLWPAVKEIYLEAFPRRERKPFSSLRRSVSRGKAQLLTAVEGEKVLGFVMAIPYEDMVMVDYLAVSRQVRSRGTGSFLMEQVGLRFAGKRIVLLIERLDEQAGNSAQRTARRRFYLRNGFAATGIFTAGAGGDMEILSRGGAVAPGEYLQLQRHALGRLFFRLSGLQLVQ